MATETEELRLQVSVVGMDAAVAGVEKLKSSLKGLKEGGGGGSGTGSSGAGLEGINKQLAEMSKQFKELVESMSRGPEALLGWVRGFGAIGVAVGGVGLAFGSVIAAMREVAKEAERLAQASRGTGLDPATLKVNYEAVSRYGISMGQLQSAVSGAGRAMADLGRPLSEIRQAFMAGPQAMRFMENINQLQAAGASGDVNKFLNTTLDQLRGIYSSWEKINPVRGRQEMQRMAEALRMPEMAQLAMIPGFKFEEASEEEKKRERERVQHAEELIAVIDRITTAWSHIAEDLFSSKHSPLLQDMKDVAKAMEGVERFFRWLTSSKEEEGSPAGALANKLGAGTVHDWLKRHGLTFDSEVPQSEPLAPSQQPPRAIIPPYQPMPGYRPTAFGDSSGDLSQGARMVKEGVFAALIDFSAFIRGGGGGGAGGGFTNAAFTTGGPAGGGTYGGGAGGFGSRQFPNLGEGTPGKGPYTVGKGGDPRGMESYIRETAAKYGIDPDTAMRVAASEGLRQFTSGIPGEKSYGAFQLHVGGGLGDEFRKATGLDPSDPANEKATIDFALKHASTHGWGAFHGAANTGIGAREGIGIGRPSLEQAARDAPGIRELQGKVAAVRRGALAPIVHNALQYAGLQTGLTAEVVSGGQRMHGAPGAVGSHRHDEGMAADFKLRDEKGNLVPINDPRAIEFYEHAARAGMAGGGAAPGYMGMYTTHLDPGHRGGVYAGSPAFRAAIARGHKHFLEHGMPDLNVARNSIDRSGRGIGSDANAITANGTVNLNVTAPGGTRVSSDSTGSLFKNVRINRNTQMVPANNGPATPDPEVVGSTGVY